MHNYKFSNRSKQALQSTHPDLQKLAENVIQLGLFDFGVSCGHRSKKEQDKAYHEGRSALMWPNSKHNKVPSTAIDIVLYVNGKVSWKNTNSWYMAIGVFRGVAATLGLSVRVGADWDGDFSTSDQSFHDLPHIELNC